MGRPKGSKNKPKMGTISTAPVAYPGPLRIPQLKDPTEQREPAVSAEPTLGMCVECNRRAANSNVDKLCYHCHKLKEGFEFNEDKKLYVPRASLMVGKRGSKGKQIVSSHTDLRNTRESQS